jgi:hypothetical protein
MAIVNVTKTSRFTNVVEYTGGTMAVLNDEMRVFAHVEATGGANFTMAFEATFNGGNTWYEVDASKTITSDGEYVYYYTGKPTSGIRMRIDSIATGTPSITPHIAVAFNG